MSLLLFFKQLGLWGNLVVALYLVTALISISLSVRSLSRLVLPSRMSLSIMSANGSDADRAVNK